MKKILIINLLLLTTLVSFGANRYLVSGGTGDWNSTTNWSTTSGGSSGASYPVAGDAVIIDTGSHNAALSINVTSACASINIDNAYTGIVSVDAGLTTTSTVRLGTGMTLTGASTWTMNSSCTITSSGKSFPVLTLGGTSQTFTLADTLRTSGLLTLNGSTATTFSGAHAVICGSLTFTNAKTVTLSCNVTSGGTTTNNPATVLNGSTLATAGLTMTGAMSGTTLLKLTGGSWSGTGAITNTSLTFDGNSTVSGSVTFNTGSLIYSSGTITTTGSALSCSANTTFNCSGMNWNDITLSGTSKTFTLSSNLTANGTLTLNGGTATTFSGSYNLVTGGLTFGSAATVTIPSSLSVSGLTTVSAATVLNGSFTLYTGGITMNAALTGTFTGILFNSTGTWSGTTAISKNVTINTAGTLTIGTVAYSTGTLTYTGGTVSPGTGTITLSSSPTLNCSGMTWANMNISSAVTLSADCNVSNMLTINTTGTALNGAYSYKVGSVTHTGASAVGGASTILMNGKGTASVTNSSGAISCPFTINTTDTITFGANFRINNCTFTYTAGTIVATGSTFETVTTASTININGSGFKMGTYLSAISQTFGGSNGFTIGTFNCHAAGKTFTFAAGKTYTITTEISIAGTSASHCAFVSNTSGTKAIVTLNQGAAEDVGFCNATDIDSSNGKTILTYKGTRSNTSNWNLVQTSPKTGAFSFN